MCRFYNCVYGKPHELPCATSLIFDEAQGTCVRPEQGSIYAKKCEIKNEPSKYQTDICYARIFLQIYTNDFWNQI